MLRAAVICCVRRRLWTGNSADFRVFAASVCTRAFKHTHIHVAIVPCSRNILRNVCHLNDAYGAALRTIKRRQTLSRRLPNVQNNRLPREITSVHDALKAYISRTLLSRSITTQIINYSGVGKLKKKFYIIISSFLNNVSRSLQRNWFYFYRNQIVFIMY